MKPRPELPGGPYVVLGLARSGAAAALALRARGQQVDGVDAGHPHGAAGLTRAGVRVHLGDEAASVLEGARTLVKSPGVPADAPIVGAARERGMTVLGELELAWRMIPNELIAVTGTNGKTTTVELIGHLHRKAGLPVAVAGNVGVALSRLAEGADATAAEGATVVCEVSSFQLEDAVAFSPEAAVLLNLAPDHLDRHGGFDAYRAAKLAIFARQDEGDIAVLPEELELDVRGLGGRAREVRFGFSPQAALCENEGALWWQGIGEPLVMVDELSLRGAHNVQNAMAAAAVCLARGVDVDAVRAGLRDFAGVPHRLEDAAHARGVLYVNDSKATNVTSTLVALRSFPPHDGEPVVHIILGGQGKGQDFTALRDELTRSARAVYLIGQDAPQIAEALEDSGVPLQNCEDIERAVVAAARAADPGEVVLLSPACASFDQFTDFEARGQRFRELAMQLD